MTHDFAKKPKANKSKPGKQKKNSNSIPGWVWLLVGIVTGIFISFLIYLTNIAPGATNAGEKPSSNVNSKKTGITDKPTTTTRFDFYTLLPEREIIVPVDKDRDNSVEKEKMVYILQAGSFRALTDADRLRAQLILMGYETKVEAVKSKNGEIWHRVQVGPFQSRSKLAKARSTLIGKGIDTLLLKRKADS